MFAAMDADNPDSFEWINEFRDERESVYKRIHNEAVNNAIDDYASGKTLAAAASENSISVYFVLKEMDARGIKRRTTSGRERQIIGLNPPIGTHPFGSGNPGSATYSG